MSSLGDRLYRDFTGRAPRELGDWHAMRDELARRYGGVRGAARESGIDRRTFQRWAEKERAGKPFKVTAATLRKLTHAVRVARLDPARPTDQTLQLEVSERAGRNAGQRRTLRAGQLDLAPGTMNRVEAAYVRTGDPEAMARALLDGVRDDFYRKWLTPAPGEQRSAAETPGESSAAGGGGRGGSSAGGGDEDDEEDQDDEEIDYDDYEDVYQDYDEPFPEVADDGYGFGVL